MKRIHYLPNYLLDPSHVLTVNIIGAGGTGSCLINRLALLNVTLKGIGHPGLQVRVWDHDVVMPQNVGRSLFYESDIGKPKSVVLVQRINRTFGFNWIAYYGKFNKRTSKSLFSNIWISCVDSLKARKVIHATLKRRHNRTIGREVPYYWIDIGNDHHYGQIVIGTVSKVVQPKSEQHKTIDRLKTFFEVFPDLMKKKDKGSDGVSCSLMNALSKQDLFINTIMADFAADLLYKLLKTATVPYNVMYINLEPYAINVSGV